MGFAHRPALATTPSAGQASTADDDEEEDRLNPDRIRDDSELAVQTTTSGVAMLAVYLFLVVLAAQTVAWVGQGKLSQLVSLSDLTASRSTSTAHP